MYVISYAQIILITQGLRVCEHAQSFQYLSDISQGLRVCDFI